VDNSIWEIRFDPVRFEAYPVVSRKREQMSRPIGRISNKESLP